ncbi:MAG: methylisocitrate lyase [Nitrososphaeria archaeon]|nr:methylisocitrate lyase [Conexivisphaerales archaeon]
MSSNKEILLNSEFLIVPGVYNPFSALLAEKAGAKAIYLSGAALTSSYGLPDLGVISLEELAYMVKKIKEVVNLPLIVDADTGFGEPLNVYRTIKVLEASGADAVQIEDQVNPKKCGHLDDKALISKEEMIAKVLAAKEASKNIVLIARTDARGVSGIDDAIDRAQAYIKAGADIIFPEALLNEEEFKIFADKVKARLLANMTEFGKTPYITAQKFKDLGYRYVIFPVTSFRAAAKAMQEVYQVLINEGTQKEILDKLMTRAQQYEVINYYFYENMDKELAKRSYLIK